MPAFRSFPLARLNREIAYAQTVIAIAGTGAIAETTTLADAIAAEITTTGYTRIVATPSGAALVASWNAAGYWETPRTQYTAAVAGGGTVAVQWVAILYNATLWSWASATANPTADTVTFATPSPAPTTGAVVLVSAGSGGSLPGGVTAGALYTLQSVTTASGQTTAKLRLQGAGADQDLTSAGSSVQIRNASGELRSYWTLDQPYPSVGQWSVITQFVEYPN